MGLLFASYRRRRSATAAKRRWICVVTFTCLLGKEPLWEEVNALSSSSPRWTLPRSGSLFVLPSPPLQRSLVLQASSSTKSTGDTTVVPVNGHYAGEFDGSDGTPSTQVLNGLPQFRVATTPYAQTTTTPESSGGNRWTEQFGLSALRQVQQLAVTVSEANAETSFMNLDRRARKRKARAAFRSQRVRQDAAAAAAGALEDPPPQPQEQQEQLSPIRRTQRQPVDEKVVLTALANLERDMQLLDSLAGQKPQLSTLEFTLLSLSIVAAMSGPIFFADFPRVAEVLGPTAAAFSASLGIGAEYIGKVAVADGKEVAAATIQCAAEAEGFLANAERVKAVLPLCVGVGATGASFAALAPIVIDAFNFGNNNVQLAVELYLLSPLVSVLAAAIASLAFQETTSYTARAISVGNRRFAKSGLVGRTWLSATEQIERNSVKLNARWKSFVSSVLPAPVIGSVVPGSLATKAIVVAALAAAQSAYFLARAESTLARATDAVALKARSAAVCDTYANQGARSAAVLPFTSALSSLCAAAAAAVVELPWLQRLAMAGSGPLASFTHLAVISVFPTLSSLFAAAASVSKARCEVDAEAATQAAATLALEYEKDGPCEDDPVLRPLQGVVELIRLSASSAWRSLGRMRRRSASDMPRFWNLVLALPMLLWERLFVATSSRRNQNAETENNETTTTGQDYAMAAPSSL